MAYPSPTTTHLIACILFRSASSVLFALTETDSERKVQRRRSACNYRKWLHTSLTPLPLLPLFLSQSLFLHCCTHLSFLFCCVWASSKQQNLCKQCVKYSTNEVNNVEKSLLQHIKSCEMNLKGFERLTVAVTVRMGFI